MYHIIYISSAVKELPSKELGDLLKESRICNEREGITGALFYKDGSFLQVIEGEEPTVRWLFERISRDPRHHGINLLFQETIPAREFADWTMAFHDLRLSDTGVPEGFNDLLNRKWSAVETAGYSVKVRAFLGALVR